jgi:RNA polymerase sigma-70 factor (ECF subfamily)
MPHLLGRSYHLIGPVRGLNPHAVEKKKSVYLFTFCAIKYQSNGVLAYLIHKPNLMTALNSRLEVAIASNDPRAKKMFFETLYELLAEEILLRAYAYFKNRPNTELLAEEALQNTFEKLMRKDLASFEDLDDITAYVLIVAYSQFANVYQQMNNRASLPLDEWTGVNGSMTTNVSAEISYDLEQAISRALNDQQRVVTLLWLEGYSYEDIAIRTGKSEPSVRGLIFRARKSLRAYLEAYDRHPMRA